MAAPSRNGTAAAPLVVPAAAAVATLPPPAAVVPKPEPVAASIPSASPASAALNTLFSMEEEEMSSDQIQCKEALRAGAWRGRRFAGGNWRNERVCQGRTA